MFFSTDTIVTENNIDYVFKGNLGAWFKSSEKKEPTINTRRMICGIEFYPYRSYKRGLFFNRTYDISWCPSDDSIYSYKNSVEDIAYFYMKNVLCGFPENPTSENQLHFIAYQNQNLKSSADNVDKNIYNLVNDKNTWFLSTEKNVPNINDTRYIVDRKFVPIKYEKVDKGFLINWGPEVKSSTFNDFFELKFRHQMPQPETIQQKESA